MLSERNWPKLLLVVAFVYSQPLWLAFWLFFKSQSQKKPNQTHLICHRQGARDNCFELDYEDYNYEK